jgi:hypothetical protein
MSEKPLTACHAEGGCIRAYEDDTCGEEGQCTIYLAILAAKEEEQERLAEVVDHVLSRDGRMNFVQSKGWIGLRDAVEAAIRGAQR